MYVDAFFDQRADMIRVAERRDGKRYLVDHRPIYEFYVEDPDGPHQSTHGHRARLVRCRNNKEFKQNISAQRGKKMFESDIKPLHKILERHYLNQTPPKLNVAFFDIEVDFDPERGYSQPEDAFMPITSVGVYQQWSDTMVCLAVPPRSLSLAQAESLTAHLGNVVICESEAQLLEMFLEIIEDADVLSGWNSEGYDIPYTVNRIIKVLGKSELRKLCLWGQMPKRREYEVYSKTRETFDLIGRIHLDYMELYKKYNYEERHSYRLDYIGEIELGEKKVVYEGTLDQLYNNDFLKFVEYNIQDVMLLDKLDKKLQFIDLANQIAHDNTVPIATVMGAVATTDQAIVNEIHRRGMIVPDRTRTGENSQAAGAYVAFPKKGYHEWVGSMDINSLYPSVFRALNMGPETLVAQLEPSYTDIEIEAKMEGNWVDANGRKHKKMTFAGAWADKFGTNEYEFVMRRDTKHPITVNFATGETFKLTGAEIFTLVFHSDQPWCISANGTIFRHDQQGVIPGLLERWYVERQEMQEKKRNAEDPADREFWDKRQLVRKINLNSLYGAVLNDGCRFYDKRIGQSTTLTGRRITRHMAAMTNKLLTGEYDYNGKTIVYGDTDSCYFSAAYLFPDDVEINFDSVKSAYDALSDAVSDSFPAFMTEDFNAPEHLGSIIKAGREVIGRAGLFITKKRYAINCLAIEDKEYDNGKLKAMGIEIKRSDTPEEVQDFLEKILTMALNGHSEADVISEIKSFRQEFKKLSPWLKGMPKTVKRLSHFETMLEKMERGTDFSRRRVVAAESTGSMIPGHVRASINWNRLREMHNDRYSTAIVDGTKIVICRLRPNPLGYTSVAYPADQPHLPDWFRELPFSDDEMEEKVLEKKINNVLGARGWDLSLSRMSETQDRFFSFG
jgi:DNA polymerase elongation subunit (family B)